MCIKLRNYTRYIFFFSLIFCVLIGCSQRHKKIDYRKAVLNIKSREFVSKDLLTGYYATFSKGEIFVIDKYCSIWRIDSSGNEAEIIKNGIGPDEIFKALRLSFFENQCWVNPNLNHPFLFRFNIDSTVPVIEKMLLPGGINRCDDLIVLSKNKIAAVDANWYDALLKVIDFDSKSVIKGGKPVQTEIMQIFNVNIANIAYHDGNAYITQSIDPRIEVFSLKTCRKIDTIHLRPPFYLPMPKKYDVPNDSNQEHKKWMARFTSIDEIFIDGNWLLLRYRVGYQEVYYYESMNLDNRNVRYYTDASAEYIFDFKVDDGKFLFWSCERDEEPLQWNTGEITIERSKPGK